LTSDAVRERRWRLAFFVVATVYVVLLAIEFVSQRLGGFAQILIVVFLAWLLAFILSPLVNALERRGLGRGLSIGLVYAGALLIGGVALIYLLTAVGTQVGQLVDNFPQTRDRIEATIAGWQSALSFGRFRLDLVAIYRDIEQQVTLTGDSMLSRIPSMGVGIIGGLVLVVILSLYMAADSARILTRFNQIVPSRYEEHAEILERTVGKAFGGFLRAQVLLAVIQAALTLVVVLATGVPYGVLIVAVSTLAMLIPFFGPPLALIPPIVAVAVYAPGWLLLVAPALLVVQTVIVNWLQPRLMRDALGMHPILVLVGLLVGAQVAGVWGALFGIPVIAVLNVLFNYLVNLRRIEEAQVDEAEEIIEEVRREAPSAPPEEIVALAAERAEEARDETRDDVAEELADASSAPTTPTTAAAPPTPATPD
jgi:predicted PurR-regulated permease PerM